jgi:hypothetical protein
MKIKLINNVIIILLGFISYIFATAALSKEPDSYLCIPDKATGFSYDHRSKSWVSTNFNLRGAKFLLIKTSKGWEWRDFGASLGQSCEADADGDLIICNLVLHEHKMSRKTLRFINSYLVGYVNGGDSDANTPSITIGKCSPL